MHKKYFHLFITALAFFGMIFSYGCSSTTWGDAQEANTYKSYQAYIADNPQGEHLAEAEARADSLYWESIKNDSTTTVFETYLQKFPEGRFRSQAQVKMNQVAPNATKARVTGSSVIIRSDHTTESASAGVVAKKGTIVQLLAQYSSGNGNEAILKHKVPVTVHGDRINLPKGKAIRIVADHDDSVDASFTTRKFGMAKATIAKDDIDAIGGQKWYKIHTTDGITGWIYGKFIEKL